MLFLLEEVYFGVKKMHETPRPPRANAPVLLERRFPSAIVRACCEKVYGKSIATGTYRNWRSWAGVKKAAKYFSFEQFCFVIAIAEVRRRTYPNAPELARPDIELIAKSVEIQEAISKTTQRLDEMGFVCGRDAVKALEDRGYKISRTNLYHKVPRFSALKVYRISYLESLVA